MTFAHAEAAEGFPKALTLYPAASQLGRLPQVLQLPSVTQRPSCLKASILVTDQLAVALPFPLET